MNDLQLIKQEKGYAMIYEKVKRKHIIEVVEIETGLAREIQCHTKDRVKSIIGEKLNSLWEALDRWGCDTLKMYKKNCSFEHLRDI